MSLREVNDTETSETPRKRRLVRVLFTEDAQIYAVWLVQRGKKHRELTTQVSEALRAHIMGRPGVQALFDNIRDNTIGATNI